MSSSPECPKQGVSLFFIPSKHRPACCLYDQSIYHPSPPLISFLPAQPESSPPLPQTPNPSPSPQKESRHQGPPNQNSTSPLLAPPRHTLLRLPVGHTARAALTHPSHRPLVTVTLAPGSTARSTNTALPARPTVSRSPVRHRPPGRPSQMESSAAFCSWKTMCLGGGGGGVSVGVWEGGGGEGAYVLRSMHCVSVMARGLRGVDWRMERTSKWDWGTVKRGYFWEEGAARVRRGVERRRRVGRCILVVGVVVIVVVGGWV